MIAKLSFRRGRPRFHDVAAGTATAFSLEPGSSEALAAFASALPRRSEATRRLRLALDRGSRDAILDLLAARPSASRLMAVRLCGALELEESTPWLELRLSDRNRSVREAAARALGRIGGSRAAEALLRGMPRERVPWFRLTVELAKAAPSLYLESALADARWHDQRPAIMLALSLRQPDLEVAGFLAATPVAGPRDLIGACHVLARSQGATAWLAALLEHQDRRVRAAADRALRRQRNSGARPVFVVKGSSAP